MKIEEKMKITHKKPVKYISPFQRRLLANLKNWDESLEEHERNKKRKVAVTS